MRIIRVLIVDDHQVVREGLRVMLTSDEVEVVGQAATGEEAVTKARDLRPDVILMDLRMPGQDGVAASREIKQGWPEARIVALTTFLEEELVAGALDAGVAAYILKDTPADELVQVLRMVCSGKTVFSSQVTAMALHRPATAEKPSLETKTASTRAGLTEREGEILKLLARGMDNHQIAQVLFISPGTVRNTVSHIYAKLGVIDRAQAILWAVEHGLTRR